VDTPGLGSVFKYRIATSENWLPEVGAALQKTILVVHFVDKETMDKESNVYATQVGEGPRVRKRPDEEHDAFYERAKRKLLGERANNPGLHLLFSWYWDPEAPLGPLED